MGLFDRFKFGRKASDPLALWAEIYAAGRKSKAGPTVNLDNALKVATAFACLKVLSQGCAQVPFKLFREVQEGGLTKITPAREMPLYDLTATQPNDWSSSYEFRETLVLHAALGNAYAFKNKVMGGKIAELILLNPGLVQKEQLEDYSIVYKVTGKSGAVQVFPAEAIWHVRGPSWDGVGGMEVLTMAREALGLAMATEETHAKLHAKGVRPSGTYSVDGPLDDKQYGQLKAWILKEMAGAENSGSPMILSRGAKWLNQTMSGLDAQHLETRRFQIEEICRFFGVMPIMVGYSDKATTYASSEQMFLAHVVHTLSPWYARIEQSADINLLSKKERASGLYFKFVAAGLLRGAAKDRAEYFAKALGSGGSPAWMTQDEVRSLEELNPMGGEAAALPKPPAQPAANSVANTGGET
jgi:HK97 family phage portal protein